MKMGIDKGVAQIDRARNRARARSRLRIIAMLMKIARGQMEGHGYA
jgi:hypothetical protein